MESLTIVTQMLLAGGLLLQTAGAAFNGRRLASIAGVPPASRAGRIAVALVLTLCVAATVAGMFIPFLVFFAACLALLASILLLARAWAGGLRPAVALAMVMIVLCFGVAVLQPLGLKVLALPKAADLPFVPLPSRVVKTYDEGLWFEGLAGADDGTLYLSGNRGLDFSRSDYYRRARGQVIQRKPDGTERVIFETPVGSTAGGVALSSDGVLFLTSHGDEPGIWKIEATGASTPLTRLPRGAWPNGLDVGPDGMLYSPDSALGLVWRIDPQTGRGDVAMRDPLLSARPFIALAPGANGLHFKGRDMYVSVSDRTTVLRYTMDSSGAFGPAQLIASGIPGDDFAIGQDGSLFITTHPYDTLVKVGPSGQRSIVGRQAQHIVGATDAVFGRTAQDKTTLYVVTDGGAFTGGPKSRGELVALTLN